MRDQVRPYETKWDHVRPCDPTWDYVRPSDTKWDQVKSCETMWDQVRSSETKWDQVRSCETMWDQVRPIEIKWDQVRSPPLPPNLLSSLAGLMDIDISYCQFVLVLKAPSVTKWNGSDSENDLMCQNPNKNNYMPPIWKTRSNAPNPYKYMKCSQSKLILNGPICRPLPKWMGPMGTGPADSFAQCLSWPLRV